MMWGGVVLSCRALRSSQGVLTTRSQGVLDSVTRGFDIPRDLGSADQLHAKYEAHQSTRGCSR